MNGKPQRAIGRASAPVIGHANPAATFVGGLWRRRALIAVPTLLVLAGTTLAVHLVTPLYTSQAHLLVEARDGSARDPAAEPIRLLTSREMARDIVATLDLAKKPAYDSAAAAGTVSDWLLRTLGLDGPPPASAEDAIVRTLAQRLDVSRNADTSTISVAVQSSDPDLAARTANAFVDAYLARRKAQVAARSTDASQRQDAEIAELRARLAEAEGRAEAFRNGASPLAGGAASQLAVQQLGDLNAQMAAIRTQKAEAEGKAKVVRDILRTGQIVETSDMLNSELIRRLVEQRITLRAQLSEQSSTLLDQHPRIKELRASIAGLDLQIRGELDRLGRIFDNDARIAGARLESMLANLDQLKLQAAGTGGEESRLRALEREVKAARDRLDARLALQRDATAATGSDIVLLAHATAARAPSYPQKLPTVLAATLVTFLLALMLAIRRQIRAMRAARRIGPPIDATPAADPVVAVPQAPQQEHPEVPPARSETPDRADTRSSPAAAPPPPMTRRDALNIVRSRDARLVALMPARGDIDAARRALDLARALTADGAEVVLVQLDPTGRDHAPSGTMPAAGIADLVRGTASFGDIIHRDPRSSLHLVPYGAGPLGLADLVVADRFAIVLSALTRSYQRVVLVLPPPGALAAVPAWTRLPLVIALAPSDWTPQDAATTFDAIPAGLADELVAVEDRPAAAMQPLARAA